MTMLLCDIQGESEQQDHNLLLEWCINNGTGLLVDDLYGQIVGHSWRFCGVMKSPERVRLGDVVRASSRLYHSNAISVNMYCNHCQPTSNYQSLSWVVVQNRAILDAALFYTRHRKIT